MTINAATDVGGQVLGAGNVSVTGAGIRAGMMIAGVDFAATAASPSGAIVLAAVGDLTLTAAAGSITASTLLSAGSR